MNTNQILEIIRAQVEAQFPEIVVKDGLPRMPYLSIWLNLPNKKTLFISENGMSDLFRLILYRRFTGVQGPDLQELQERRTVIPGDLAQNIFEMTGYKVQNLEGLNVAKTEKPRPVKGLHSPAHDTLIKELQRAKKALIAQLEEGSRDWEVIHGLLIEVQSYQTAADESMQ